MPVLENVARPADQRDDYRFFRDIETGRTFKAKQTATTSARGDPALCITVAPVDADGKALLNLADDPDVYSHTHTFTATELEDPAFDMNARVATIILEAIGRKQTQLAAQDRLAALAKTWGGKRAIPLKPVASVEPIAPDDGPR